MVGGRAQVWYVVKRRSEAATSTAGKHCGTWATGIILYLAGVAWRRRYVASHISCTLPSTHQRRAQRSIFLAWRKGGTHNAGATILYQ